MAHFIHRCNGHALLVTTEESENLVLLARVYPPTISVAIKGKLSIHAFDLYTACKYFIPNWDIETFVYESELRSIIDQIIIDNKFNHYLVINFYILHHDS